MSVLLKKPTPEPTPEPTLVPTTKPTIEPIDSECIEITAKYTTEGALIELKIKKIKRSEIIKRQNTPTEKIFYWESLESMKPINLIK